MSVSISADFGCFFKNKTDIWADLCFSAKRKNSRFSIIPARTRSFVIVGYFFGGLDGPTKFCWAQTKIKGNYYSDWHWPKMVNFFQGGPSGKFVAPSILLICPVDKNRDSKTKTWLLAPNIQILGSKKHIFAPSGQLEPRRSMFSTRKRCLIRIPIWGYQNFYSLPPKNWILGPKTAKFGPKSAFLVILGQIMAFLIHLVLCLTIEIIRTRCVGGFLICGYQNFCSFPK